MHTLRQTQLKCKKRRLAGPQTVRRRNNFQQGRSHSTVDAKGHCACATMRGILLETPRCMLGDGSAQLHTAHSSIIQLGDVTHRFNISLENEHSCNRFSSTFSLPGPRPHQPSGSASPPAVCSIIDERSGCDQVSSQGLHLCVPHLKHLTSAFIQGYFPFRSHLSKI